MQPTASSAPTTYKSSDRPAALNTGDSVTVASGPLAGQTFDYIGSELAGSVQWDLQNFADTGTWVDLGTGGKRPTQPAIIPPRLKHGDTVTVESGTYKGHVFEYVGQTPLAGVVDLSVVSYDDPTAWQQTGMTQGNAQILAYSAGSDIASGGALSITATDSASINATVVAASVAVAGGGNAGVGVSAGGAFAQNLIGSDAEAYINGDAGNGLSAASATIAATDAAGIQVVAGAASLAGAAGGDAGIAVSIGLGIALNNVSGAVSATVENLTHGLRTTTGDVSISAPKAGSPSPTRPRISSSTSAATA